MTSLWKDVIPSLVMTLLPMQLECLEANVFTRVCHSVHRGRACMGVHRCGGACMCVGGIHAWDACTMGVCMVRRVVVKADMCGEIGCMVKGGVYGERGVCGERGRNASGHYASYWNAFLFYLDLFYSPKVIWEMQYGTFSQVTSTWKWIENIKQIQQTSSELFSVVQFKVISQTNLTQRKQDRKSRVCDKQNELDSQMRVIQSATYQHWSWHFHINTYIMYTRVFSWEE